MRWIVSAEYIGLNLYSQACISELCTGLQTCLTADLVTLYDGVAGVLTILTPFILSFKQLFGVL